MAKTASPSWSFTNRRGRVISTENAVDAEKYRNDPNFTEVTDAPSADQVDDTGHVLPYDDRSWTKEKLQAEIEARNDAAGDDEHAIEVEEPGNRPQLIAALQADDAARAEAAANTTDTGA